MSASVLDGIPGLGPARRKRLVSELGSIKAVREAPREALEALPWLPRPVADAIWDKIHAPRQAARTGSASARRASGDWAGTAGTAEGGEGPISVEVSIREPEVEDRDYEPAPL